MRYLISMMAVALLSVSIPFAYAKDKVKPRQLVKAEQVSLYAQPSQKSHVVMKVSPWHTWIPIYRKGDWLKVGNPEDGKIGWLNMPQYRRLVTNIIQPIVRDMYVSVTRTPDNHGKYKITAYKNGKKLSDKDAKKLFRQMRSDQWSTERQFWRMRRQMNRWFYRRMRDFDENFDPPKEHKELWKFKMLNPKKIIEKKSIFNFESMKDKIRKAKEGKSVL